MNVMNVNPLFLISPDGPVSAKCKQLIHLRQGELDGACGPYCLVSALIALDLLDRNDVISNMWNWKGSTREGKFRDALYAFGSLVSEGTDGQDMIWLTDFFKGKGLQAKHITGNKKQVFQQITDGIDQGELPIVGVKWAGLGGHWMLVVGYQGVQNDEGLQLTHLLCLDPGVEAPKASLWNAVIEVFTDTGASVNQGRLTSNYWGIAKVSSKCQIEDSVILSV